MSEKPSAGEGLALLQEDEQKDLLRLVTCGSVDDGKSTLIGRLLYESKGIYEDQLEAVRVASAKRAIGDEGLDLSLVTDGLRAEREQGITIDVAYRYFSTPKRKFIIADTPGHEQYTRNMATGASTANLAILLIDAAQGVLTQSRRHAFIASLLRIPHVVAAVNKMDLVGYDRKVFDAIVDEFTEFCARLEITDLTFIPISALKGDNVVRRSEKMSWYSGATLLGHLESVHIASDRNLIDLRFPVQYVSRPDATFRGYMGTPASGIVRPGDEIIALPSGVKSKVKEVLGPNGPVREGFPPVPCTVTLSSEIDVSRGDVLAHPNNVPRVDHRFDAMLVWMSEEPLRIGDRYTIKHLARRLPGRVMGVRYRIDVNSTRRQEAEILALNEIGRVMIELERPLAFDSYKRNRATGAFIVIDRLTNNTVGAGMILDRGPGGLSVDPSELPTRPRSELLERQRGQVTRDDRAQRFGHKAATVWLTGLAGAGKTTIAYALEKKLFDQGVACAVLDGENTRLGLSLDLGFTARDRAENIRRAAEVAAMMNDAGLIVICAFLSPSEADRQRAKEIIGEERFVLVHVDTPIEECRERLEELYGRAERTGDILVPGVNLAYEVPKDAELVLRSPRRDVTGSIDRLLPLLTHRAGL